MAGQEATGEREEQKEKKERSRVKEAIRACFVVLPCTLIHYVVLALWCSILGEVSGRTCTSIHDSSTLRTVPSASSHWITDSYRQFWVSSR